MSKEIAYYRLAMRIFADFGITIAVPAVVAALVGTKLDERFQTEPLFLIILFVVAITITTLILYKKAKEYEKSYSALIRKEETKK